MSDGQLADAQNYKGKLQNTRVSGQCFHGILNAGVPPLMLS